MTAEPAPDDGPEPRVQMNVRIPESLRDTIDARRNAKGLSRDKWVERALRYALRNSPAPRTPTSGTVRRTP